MAIISDDLALAINNMSPAAQNAQIGTRLQEALAGEMPDGSVSTAELANLSVTEGKIAALAVAEAKIAAGAVVEAKLGALAVTSGKIANLAVTTGKVAANAITLAKIETGKMLGIASDDAKTTSREENIDGLASAIVLANSLQTVNNAHAADGTEHGTSADATNYPDTTTVASDLATLLALAGTLLTAYAAHNADAILGGAWVFHNAQQAGNILASDVTPTTLEEAVTRLNDLKAQYNTHEGSAASHTAGSAHTEATADAAYGVAILVVEADVLPGDLIVWGILDSGTGTVVGVSGAAGTGVITFTFNADPQNDAVLTYGVFRAAP